MKFLKIRLERLKVTQGKMAEICGVTQSTISRWDKGWCEPSISDLDKILKYAKAQHIKLKPSDLFEDIQ